MKSVLISIQPKWCKKITNIIGQKDRTPIYEKDVEARKTRPKIETPFKCYVYCTSSNVHECLMVNESGTKLIHTSNYKKAIPCGGYIGNGKAIGEFVCDEIVDAENVGGDEFHTRACMNMEEWLKYTDKHKGKVWLWHISDLVIYDKPKELSEFHSLCKKGNCHLCDWEREYDSCGCNRKKPLTRPPQSWRYVEEVV